MIRSESLKLVLTPDMEGDMTEQTKRQTFAGDGITAPLRYTVFRRIWLASLLSNLGLLIQGQICLVDRRSGLAGHPWRHYKPAS